MIGSPASKGRGRGFTLIEVAVALAIIAWVLGSALFLVSQYADERGRMRDRFLASQVSWNQLMDQYRKVRQWEPVERQGLNASQGREKQGGQDWYWTLQVEPALGRDFYRYRVATGATRESDRHNSLVMYQVVKSR